MTTFYNYYGITKTDEKYDLIALRDNLRGDQHTQTVLKNKKAATYKAAGYSGDTYCAFCGNLIAKGHTIAKLKAKSSRSRYRKKPPRLLPSSLRSSVRDLYPLRFLPRQRVRSPIK